MSAIESVPQIGTGESHGRPSSEVSKKDVQDAQANGVQGLRSPMVPHPFSPVT
ncbi:UNVERIFIED_ORG: hypothetical protein ABIC54_006698 [Burkholderia sp. 1263]|jgi:hypothetical protein|nr:hypothetical protein [Paraburkholderia terricola]